MIAIQIKHEAHELLRTIADLTEVDLPEAREALGRVVNSLHAHGWLDFDGFDVACDERIATAEGTCEIVADVIAHVTLRTVSP